MDNQELGEALEQYEEELSEYSSEEPKKAARITVHKLTDLGNSERFVDQWKHDVRFCHPMGKWLIFNEGGSRWEIDATDYTKRLAKKTIRSIYREASEIANKEFRGKVSKHAHLSEADTKIRAMLSLARSEKNIPVMPDQLDRDPMAFNCQNGTIDLSTGQLKPHNRKDLITKIASVRYDPKATCPKWKGFLDQIMSGNQALITFLQVAVGYTLTGATREQCLFFLYGTGANGKSSFIEVIRSLLGDYATQTDFNTFLQQKYESVRNDLARLKSARMVSAVEAGPGKRLAEILVKQVTGGDVIAARFLFREYFEFRPEFKIWLAANHKPEIRGRDYAIWRRIRLIPFNVTIPKDKQDRELPEKLREELPGILAWAVEGCLQWQSQGLGIPEEVETATLEYQQEMDILGAFLADQCLIGQGLKARAKDLYKEYCQWCEKNGEQLLKQRTFGTALSERGLKTKRGAKGVYFRHGIGLKAIGTDDNSQEHDTATTRSWEAI